MKEELVKIIDDLKDVLNEENLHISNFELLDLALRLYNTEKINQSRDYPRQMNQWKKPEPKPLQNEIPEELATSKQIYAIKQAGKEVPLGLTKKQAFNIIKEMKK